MASASRSTSCASSPSSARIVVGPRRALAVQSMRVADWNWIGEDQTRRQREGPLACAGGSGDARRRLGPLRRGRIWRRAGQAAVLYDGTRLLGGGWIAETRSARAEPSMPPPLSAGVLLFRRGISETEVLLIKPGGPFWRNKDAGAWMIPKGKVEAGEAPAEAHCVSSRRRLARRLDRRALSAGQGAAGWRKDGRGLRARGRPRRRQGRSRIEFEMEWPPRSGRLRDASRKSSRRGG